MRCVYMYIYVISVLAAGIGCQPTIGNNGDKAVSVDVEMLLHKMAILEARMLESENKYQELKQQYDTIQTVTYSQYIYITTYLIPTLLMFIDAASFAII